VLVKSHFEDTLTTHRSASDAACYMLPRNSDRDFDRKIFRIAAPVEAKTWSQWYLSTVCQRGESHHTLEPCRCHHPSCLVASPNALQNHQISRLFGFPSDSQKHEFSRLFGFPSDLQKHEFSRLFSGYFISICTHQVIL
jgi:hypothetical protein